jgi:hypothetical protein
VPAASPFTYETSTAPSKFPLAKARSQKFSPSETDGQLRSVVGVMMVGGFNVEAPNDGTSSTSDSVSPAASRISDANPSKPFVFAVKYAKGSMGHGLIRQYNTRTRVKIPYEAQHLAKQQCVLQYHRHTTHCGTSTSGLLARQQFSASSIICLCFLWQGKGRRVDRNLLSVERLFRLSAAVKLSVHLHDKGI